MLTSPIGVSVAAGSEVVAAALVGTLDEVANDVAELAEDMTDVAVAIGPVGPGHPSPGRMMSCAQASSAKY
jgi:hypothetical protein